MTGMSKKISFIDNQDSASNLMENNSRCCSYNKKSNNSKMMTTLIKNWNNYYYKCNGNGTCGSFMKAQVPPQLSKVQGQGEFLDIFLFHSYCTSTQKHLLLILFQKGRMLMDP